jgi:hypothetical protein
MGEVLAIIATKVPPSHRRNGSAQTTHRRLSYAYRPRTRIMEESRRQGNQMNITPDQITGIVERHGKWLRDEPGGERAYLAGANLARANLAGANLARANLNGAYLARADLARANLARANLNGADLARADLARAYLARADLAGADLAGADLAGADLAGAYLAGAYLAGANLSSANLSGANLSGANLSGADMRGANGIYRTASVSFTGHGECGRLLCAIIREKGQPAELSCGCFTGDTGALRGYIEKGPAHLRKTRTLALDTVLSALEMQNDDASDGGKE